MNGKTGKVGESAVLETKERETSRDRKQLEDQILQRCQEKGASMTCVFIHFKAICRVVEAAPRLWLVEERVGDGEAESVIAKYTVNSFQVQEAENVG